jgi:hypothetical protein
MNIEELKRFSMPGKKFIKKLGSIRRELVCTKYRTVRLASGGVRVIRPRYGSDIRVY